MKFLAFFVYVIGFGFRSIAATEPNAERQLNIKSETMVSTSLFSIKAPKGWSFVRFEDQTPKAEILVTPTSNTDSSDIYVSVVYAKPVKFDSEKVLKSHKGDHASLTKQIWSGRSWDVVKFHDTARKLTNWMALTNSKNGQVVVVAGVSSDKAKEFENQIESVMKSTAVSEK